MHDQAAIDMHFEIDRLHKFNWHGTDKGNKTKQVPGALVFSKLKVIPDQFYYNVSTCVQCGFLKQTSACTREDYTSSLYHMWPICLKLCMCNRASDQMLVLVVADLFVDFYTYIPVYL